MDTRNSYWDIRILLSEVLLQREQYYFDTYHPDYNILKVAGSPIGYRHSEAAKKQIGIASKDREVQESTWS